MRFAPLGREVAAKGAVEQNGKVSLKILAGGYLLFPQNTYCSNSFGKLELQISRNLKKWGGGNLCSV